MKGDSKSNLNITQTAVCKPNNNRRLPLSTTLEVIGKTNFPNVDKTSSVQLFSDQNVMTPSTSSKELRLQTKNGAIDFINTNPKDVALGMTRKCESNEVSVELLDQKSNKKIISNHYVVPTTNMEIGIESNCVKDNKQITVQQNKNSVIDNEVIKEKLIAFKDNTNERNVHFGKQNSQSNPNIQFISIDSNTQIYNKKYKNTTETDVERNVLIRDTKTENIKEIISHEKHPHITGKNIDNKHKSVTFVTDDDSEQNFEKKSTKNNSKNICALIENEKDSEIVLKDMNDIQNIQTCNNDGVCKNCKLVHYKSDIDNTSNERDALANIHSNGNIKKESENVHSFALSPKVNKPAVQEVSVDKVTLKMKCQNEERESELLTIDKEIEEFNKFLKDEKLKFLTLNKNCSRSLPKMWKPVEIESLPLINVTATLKEHQLLMKTNRPLKYESEFDLCLTPEPIEITGRAILVPGNVENSSFNNVVPNNSARSDVEINVELDKDKKEEQKDVAVKAYNKWKSFIRMKKKKNLFDKQNLLPADKKILEKYFDKWVKFWVDEKLQKRKLMRQEMKEKKLAASVKAVVIQNKELKLEKNLLEGKHKTEEKPVVKPKIISGSEIFVNRYKALLKVVEEQKEKLVIQKEIIGKLNEEHLLKESQIHILKSKQEVAMEIKKYDHRHQPNARIFKQNSETENKNNNYLVQRMVQRAEEIRQANKLAKMKRAEIEERKKLEENELEKIKKIKEKEAINALKIEKQRKKDMETRQYLETRLKMLKLQRMMYDANVYYERKLLKNCFEKLKNTVELRNRRLAEARLHNEESLVKKYFNKWAKFAADSTEQKMEIAKQFYYVSLLQKYWRAWCRHHEDYIRMKQVSVDLFDFKLQQKYFRRWCVFTSQQYLRSINQMEEARKFYERHLLRSAFKQWKQYPKVVLLYREQELRRQSWRHKVKEILPDFCPILNDELET